MLIGPSLVFPQWDMVRAGYSFGEDEADYLQVTTILCVFLLSYVYGEGKVISLWMFLLRAIAKSKIRRATTSKAAYYSSPTWSLLLAFTLLGTVLTR